MFLSYTASITHTLLDVCTVASCVISRTSLEINIPTAGTFSEFVPDDHVTSHIRTCPIRHNRAAAQPDSREAFRIPKELTMLLKRTEDPG